MEGLTPQLVVENLAIKPSPFFRADSWSGSNATRELVPDRCPPALPGLRPGELAMQLGRRSPSVALSCLDLPVLTPALLLPQFLRCLASDKHSGWPSEQRLLLLAQTHNAICAGSPAPCPLLDLGSRPCPRPWFCRFGVLLRLPTNVGLTTPPTGYPGS